MDHPYYSFYPLFYPVPYMPNSMLVSEEPKPQPIVKEEPKSEEQKKKKQEKKKRKRRGKKRSLSEEKTKGHWSGEENKSYHIFLEVHSNHFIMKQKRRMDKIFRKMSMFLESRLPEQCRSHHQKMEKKYRSFYNIIRNLRLKHFSSIETFHVKRQIQASNIFDHEELISQEVLKNIRQDEELPFDGKKGQILNQRPNKIGEKQNNSQNEKTVRIKIQKDQQLEEEASNILN